MLINELKQMNLPVPAVIFCGNINGFSCADANELFCEMLGYSRAELFELDYTKLMEEEKAAETALDLFELMMSRDIISSELSFRRKDGSPCWVKGAATIYRQEEDLTYIIATYTSIDKLRQSQAEVTRLSQNESLMKEATGEVPFELRLKDWSLLVSSRFDTVREDGKKVSTKDYYVSFKESLEMIHPLDRESFTRAMKDAAAKEKSGIIENRINIAKDGEQANFKWFRLYYRSIANKSGKPTKVIGRSFNIDEDKLDREAARRDYLTHFFLKGEIIKVINQQLTDRPDLQQVLMVIDIDNFKSINDTFGHTFGDNVIIDNANIIRSILPGTALIGRVGGDEFVVLLRDASIEKASAKAKELCEALKKEYTGENIARQISASIGLAEFGKHGNDYESLFEQADRAMYRVKKAGKNSFQVANIKDKKPIELRVKKSEDRLNINENDKQFMMFAVNLMTHARNIDGSLNMLLKRIGDQFSLEHVLLFENVPNQKCMILTNYYSDKYELYEKTTVSRTQGYFDDFDISTMQIYEGDSATGIDIIDALNQDKEADTAHIKAMAVSRYEYIGGRDGFLCFLSEKEEYDWSEHLQAMLLELTRMISIFVSLRYRMDESQAELRHVQRRDQLTGLYNFEPFKSKAVAHIEHDNSNNVFALEYMDISNFGYINENYGYKIGDSVLKHLAEDLKAQPYFVTGCRIYSDFFLLLYVGVDEVSLIEDIKAQHRRFSNMQNYQYPSSGVGISSGIFFMDKAYPDMDAAFENVTLAWKQSKTSRKKEMFVFTQELREIRSREQQILGEFYESLYRDDFQVYLQPKFDLGSRNVYGAEALVRWKKQTGEILSPASFLDPLEKIGYITELDFYVFEELLRNMVRWSKLGKRELVFSTNFSGRHFENGGRDFINRIKLFINKYPVNPNNIELEITESVLIQEKNVVLECLKEIREMGFRVAIDDFGTGYSSLSILSEIPADVVKMDKSFIDAGLTDNRKALLSEFAKLVEVAGKDTIFEGIETDEQEKFLAECGYKHGQGYIMSRPIALAEFEKIYL